MIKYRLQSFFFITLLGTIFVSILVKLGLEHSLFVDTSAMHVFEPVYIVGTEVGVDQLGCKVRNRNLRVSWIIHARYKQLLPEGGVNFGELELGVVLEKLLVVVVACLLEAFHDPLVSRIVHVDHVLIIQQFLCFSLIWLSPVGLLSAFLK